MRGLTPAQFEIYEAGWRSDARFRIAVCGRRFGKALDVSTLIPSPAGWLTMEKIQPGDKVYDETGRPCEVVATGPVLNGRRCYEIEFSDRISVVCDADHLWPVVLRRHSCLVEHVLDTRTMEEKLNNGERLWLRVAGAIESGASYAAFVRSDPIFSLSVDERLSRISRELCKNGSLFGEHITLERGRPQFAHLARSCGFLPLDRAGHLKFGLLPDGHIQREIIGIRRVSSRPVRCIQVDSPSSLYLCSKGFIPTHNTFLIGEELRRAARLAVQRKIPVENEIWYGAPSFLQAKRVMWGRLKAIIPSHWLAGRPNETTSSLTLVTGHRLRIVGLDAHDGLRGSGVWFFAGDEWADVRPEAWAETIRPMLSTASGHALFVGTPKGHNHFYEFYQRGMKSEEVDHKAFRFTTADGGQVDNVELEAARRLLDPRTFRQEYEASFESDSGRVFYGFSLEESVRSAPEIVDSAIHIGMDFNVNPMSATVWKAQDTRLWQIDEIVIPTSNTDEMVSVIRQRYCLRDFSGIDKVDHITIYPDPAGQQRKTSAGGRTDVSILSEAGFKVRMMNSHPAVRDRVNIMNRFFQSGDGTRFAFVDPKCRLSIRSYEQLCYRDNSSEIDKSTGHDHLADASGYFLYWWGTRRNETSGVAPRFLGR